jgi:uncharacterized protein
MASPIVHAEIPANDPKAAGKFYHEVFGWALQLDETFDYLQFTAEGGPGGAFVKIGDGPDYKAGEVIMYLGTEDVAAALAAVEAHGGKTVVPQTEIPGMGWFGIFSDPSGNRVGLFGGGMNDEG